MYDIILHLATYEKVLLGPPSPRKCMVLAVIMLLVRVIKGSLVEKLPSYEDLKMQ